MNNKENYDIVIGGGIAGIITAHLLKKNGHKVLLLEKESKLGGLLNSKQINGRIYDHGTHLLRKTGIDDLDDFLFSGLDHYEFPYVKSGSYNKILFDKNGFLSDFSLPESTRKECLDQLLKISQQYDKEHNNLEEQLIAIFGNGYYNYLLKPIIEKSFFKQPSELIPDSHLLFGLSRIVIGEPTITDKLKEDEKLNKVIAYYSFLQGLSPLVSLYPKKGGAEEWIKLIEDKIRQSGVQIELNANFNIDFQNNEILHITTKGVNYPVRNIYWTIPPVFLYQHISLQKPVTKPPDRLSSIIIDIEYAGEIMTDLYYLQVYDPELKSFRVTLYDNYDYLNTTDLKRITVELLTNQNDIDLDYYSKCAKDELLKMGIVANKNNLNVVNAYAIKGGFPIPTPEFRNDSDALINGLNNVSNLKLFGKASGKSWFMNEVLIEIYNHFKL